MELFVPSFEGERKRSTRPAMRVLTAGTARACIHDLLPPRPLSGRPVTPDTPFILLILPQTDEGITYPFTSFAGDITFNQPMLANRMVDFNTEGMVHLGLVVEVIEEVRRDGVSDEELEPLFRSAESYIRMWEKSEERGRVISADN